MNGEHTKPREALSEDLKVGDVLVTMASRFISGNSIPVERTQITRREWDVVVADIDRLRRQVTRLERTCQQYAEAMEDDGNV